jgi:hypothetical protein
MSSNRSIRSREFNACFAVCFACEAVRDDKIPAALSATKAIPNAILTLVGRNVGMDFTGLYCICDFMRALKPTDYHGNGKGMQNS